jgi:hypothetical protein
MIKQINETWGTFWRTAKNWALMMDADPLEDVHSRLRRLEAAGCVESRVTRPRSDRSLL